MPLECHSREVEEFRWAKVTAKDNTRNVFSQLFLDFCFTFRMKNKATNVKPMPVDDHEEVIIMKTYRLKPEDAWGSYTFYER